MTRRLLLTPALALALGCSPAAAGAAEASSVSGELRSHARYGPSGAAFVKALERFLEKTGYT